MRKLKITGILAAASWLLPASAQAEVDRWPLWPSEVQITAQALHEEKPTFGSEKQKLAALKALESFATPLIEAHLLKALQDSSPAVLQAVLSQCQRRKLRACVPKATQIWTSQTYPEELRLLALKVLFVDPSPARIDILIQAMKHPQENIRVVAVEIAGKALLSAELQNSIRTALLTKLADPSPLVRSAAAFSLGLLGPGPGAITLAGYIDDPSPIVRTHVAEALGHLQDAHAVPALLRSLEQGDEIPISLARLEALSKIPDPQVDRSLLDFLDIPPRGLSREQVAEALGRRTPLHEDTMDQLVDRLSEENLRPYAMQALQWQGSRAEPALLRARSRGLAPQIAIEVANLLALINLPSSTNPEPLTLPFPQPHEQSAWHRRLQIGTPQQRFLAAEALALQNPPWLAAAIQGALHQSLGYEQRREWLLALALSSPKFTQDSDRNQLFWQIFGWAKNSQLPLEDRCLSIFALPATVQGKSRKQNSQMEQTINQLAADPSAMIRSCTATAVAQLPQLSSLLHTFLYDTSARVRASAILALTAQHQRQALSQTVQALLATLALRDEDPRVRKLARWAVRSFSNAKKSTSLQGAMALFLPGDKTTNWQRRSFWLSLSDLQLQVPALQVSSLQFAFVPRSLVL